MRTGALLAVGIALVSATGCGPASDDGADTSLLRLDFGKRGTDQIVGYYFGGVFHPPQNPFQAGLVMRTNRSYSVRLDSLTRLDSLVARDIVRAAGKDRLLDWDEFTSFLSDHHTRIRRQPELSAVMAEFASENSNLLRVEVDGVMSTLRRRILVRRSDVLDALRSYEANGGRLLYRVGTTFVGQHLHAQTDSVLETTVMIKRHDDQWDFFAYQADGLPADSTLPRPRALTVPTQCVGCHLGSKLYEPEKSFPGRAADGPHGPRAMYVSESLRDPTVVAYFDEHRRRSDHVLGLYATLLTAELRHARTTGTIDADAVAVLESLGL